ncbi:hypothetical protein GOP47_0008817 [Adiantum capillus-veneris]|uniref:Potassium transporter n=1 Tax=Adiantum capillus-veneris TaxID=13818 RepID=A0A9D4V0J0_ADICA|nr:hypothetical protein GOP47_0008817 [Adiantum capillus-veneris]
MLGSSQMDNSHLQLDQPLDVEAGRLRGLLTARKAIPAFLTLRFAFQSLGVVYGDLGTSPLYVFHSIFPDGFDDREDLMGALALITYALFLLPLLKYTMIVMRANDNGEGGSFALYSLICRHVKINTIPNQHPTDRALTTYHRYHADAKPLASRTKRWLEENYYGSRLLVLLVLFGTSMLIGDGILTPAMSVLSSVGGLELNDTNISKDWVVTIACIILVALFSVQRFGTSKVGWLFAPAVFVWLLSIGSIGIYNIIKHDHGVLQAFLNPVYIVRYVMRNKKRSWVSLGGVLLSITGTEALYADVGHFSTSAVQIAFGGYVFPCLLASYVGQAAYLAKHPDDVSQAFYKSIPGPVYWPVFVIATIVAIIASQATISATFSIVKQSVALGCFPRVKVIYTSTQHLGQVYIPEINWILMVLCIIITAGFQGTVQIGNAYGIAVVALMLVTTILMGLVMLLVWRTRLIWIVIFVSVYLVVELALLSSMLFKFEQGGWAPLAIGAVFLLVMYSWHYGTLKKHEIELQNKLPMDWILHLAGRYESMRVPGIGFIYSELAHGVPSIFSHFMTHIPAMHTVVVFVCIKYLPVNTVPNEERFLFRQIGGQEYRLYRCVVRYGYRDLHKRDEKFEDNLLENLAQYIRFHTTLETSEEGSGSQLSETSVFARAMESQITGGSDSIVSVESERSIEMTSLQSSSLPQDISASQHVRFALPQQEPSEAESVLTFLNEAKYHGVVHILGDVVVRARHDSSWLKKFAVDYMYAFLRRFCRENSAILNIPHETLFNVGQVYYV